jgi:hypothetical protein
MMMMLQQVVERDEEASSGDQSRHFGTCVGVVESEAFDTQGRRLGSSLNL